MPKRMVDYEAAWASDKISALPEWAQAEYLWMYGLADANGSFELTNVRYVYAKVYASRPSITLERFKELLQLFEGIGLLFAWTKETKRYGHWTGSEKGGRLPSISQKAKYRPLAPPVPQRAYVRYLRRLRRQKNDDSE